MSDEEGYNSEEDVDYVPEEGEQVSEEENSGEEEDLSLLHDDESQSQKASAKRKKPSKRKNSLEPRKRKGGIKLDASDVGADGSEEQSKVNEEEEKRKKELAQEIAREEGEKKKEKEKKRTDDLWSSFMSDVKTVPAKKPVVIDAAHGSGTDIKVSSTKKEEDRKPQPSETEKGGKVTITKVFDFAGEEVKITKEVDANSKEAKAEQKKQEKATQEEHEQKSSLLSSSFKSSMLPSSLKSSLLSPNLSSPLGTGEKRPAVGGLGSVLNKINKKSKMGTLEKSKLDWQSFKQKEGINEDLKIHNKGKQGYTERMAFLNRADQRQYEIERDLRLGSNSKR